MNELTDVTRRRSRHWVRPVWVDGSEGNGPRGAGEDMMDALGC